MIRKGLFLLFLVLMLNHVAFTQKVKYKDLLVLLNAKQYEQAEPFLKRYLADEDGNASAYLFMGIIYQEKSAKNDPLKQTEILINNIDSATLFYERALPKITEKDIKKNDENYTMYTRRDLRTGEFGIKLSDIQLDIDTRIKALKERKERVISLKKYFQLAEVQYNRANGIYKKFQSRFATKKDLYLQSDDQIILDLDQLASTFDSSQVSFKNYKTTTSALGKTGHNQIIDLQEIKDFKKEGSSMSDFMEDDLKLWDYTEWAKKTVRIIRDEVFPLRKELLVFDSEINKMREKINKDSIPVNAEELSKSSVFTDLRKWDSDPMPSLLFHMKISELNYTSDVMTEARLKASDNISKKINLIKRQQGLLVHLDSLSTAMVNRDWDKDAINYKDFVTTAYGTTAVLKNLSKATQEFAKREMTAKKKELDDNMSLLKWVFSESDSIPLFSEVSEESRFKPLVITEGHTAGITMRDSLLGGYFYTVTPSRSADLKANFPVDSVSITLRDLPLIKGISLAVADQSYFILYYSESKVAGKIPVSLSKITRVSGLEWSTIFQTELTPVELKFSPSTGELSIKTSSPDGNSKMVVIDKLGKRLQ